jgi:FkbM family methyltransferase
MLKRILKNAALRFGYDVQRFEPARSRAAQLRAILASHDINLILDVGANVGQFGRELRGPVGYRGRIVSFEPMRAAHQALVTQAAGDPLWEVALRTAVGARSGSITLNIAGNSASSSLLTMLAAHADAAPESRLVGTEVVPLQPLDSLAPEYFRTDSRGFLKIDTQGYESEVLLGAEQTLPKLVGVQMELSLVPLYEGQLLMPELMERVTALGFDLWAVAPAFVDARNGRMLQIDATFMRRRSEQRAGVRSAYCGHTSHPSVRSAAGAS